MGRLDIGFGKAIARNDQSMNLMNIVVVVVGKIFYLLFRF